MDLLTAIKELLESLCVWLPLTGTSAECKQSIDQIKPALFTFAIIAILAGLLYRLFREKQIDASKAYDQLDKTYLALYQSAMLHPHVIDPYFTYHYDEHSGEKRLIYEAYAFQVWIIYETIYDMLCLGEEPSRLAWIRGWLKSFSDRNFYRACAKRSWPPVRKIVQREAKRSMSRLPMKDWLTWRTALDIEARLHIKWFVIEDRSVLTFKRKLRDHVIMHYAPYIARLKHDAFARYDPTNGLRHLDCLRSKGSGRDFEEIPIHGFDEGIRILRQKSAPSLAEATSSKVGSNVV